MDKKDFCAQPIDEDDVSRLIIALCDIFTIAESSEFREVTQVGYGDIQEIAENALDPFRIVPRKGESYGS